MASAESQWNWGEQRLHHVVSHVHTYAGQVEKANQAQDAALAAYPSGNFQGRSQIELHRAAVFVRSGDIDAGMTHVTSTLERLAPWQRDDGIVRRSVKLTLDVNTTKLSGCGPESDGWWLVVGDSSVFAFSDEVVVVVAVSFDGAGVGAVSSFCGSFEDLVDGLGASFPELVRGKNPPGW